MYLRTSGSLKSIVRVFNLRSNTRSRFFVSFVPFGNVFSVKTSLTEVTNHFTNISEIFNRVQFTYTSNQKSSEFETLWLFYAIYICEKRNVEYSYSFNILETSALRRKTEERRQIKKKREARRAGSDIPLERDVKRGKRCENVEGQWKRNIKRVEKRSHAQHQRR